MSSSACTPEQLVFALTYPFPAPKRDFIFYEGRALTIFEAKGTRLAEWQVSTGTRLLRFGDVATGRRKEIPDIQSLTPVIAAGSNASPLQLYRKFGTGPDIVIPCLRARLHGWSILYANHIAAYGSIPASINPSAGVTTSVTINFLDPAALAIMDASETPGVYYDVVEVSPLTSSRFAWFDGLTAKAYSSHTGTIDFRLPTAPALNSPYIAMSQWEIQSHVRNLLGEDVSVEEFVAQNISNAQLRLDRERRLVKLMAGQSRRPYQLLPKE